MIYFEKTFAFKKKERNQALFRFFKNMKFEEQLGIEFFIFDKFDVMCYNML